MSPVSGYYYHNDNCNRISHGGAAAAPLRRVCVRVRIVYRITSNLLSSPARSQKSEYSPPRVPLPLPPGQLGAGRAPKSGHRYCEPVMKAPSETFSVLKAFKQAVSAKSLKPPIRENFCRQAALKHVETTCSNAFCCCVLIVS